MNLTYGIKKLLSVLAAMSIALCCLPLSAAAADEWKTWGDIKYCLDGDTLTIAPKDGAETAAMPDAESYYDVPWYYSRKNITFVVIEDGITHIGDYAFYGFTDIWNIYDAECPNVEGLRYHILKYPKNLKSFGIGSFMNCSRLTTVISPDNLYSADGSGNCGEIPDSLFDGCSRLEIITVQQQSRNKISYNQKYPFYLPDNICRIGKFAFSGCSKLNVTNGSLAIPSSVKTIDNYAFEDCTTITNMHLIGSIERISPRAFNGCTSLSRIYIQLGTGQAAGHEYYYIPNNYNGPELYNKAQTKFIRLMPAYPETEYTVLETADEIGDYAFYSSVNLEKITLGAGVKEIGRYVFGDCNSLLNIEVSAANQHYKSVDGVLYSKDGKTLIAYPGGRTEKSFKIPDGVTTIASGALDCDSLTELYIPKSVTEMPLLSYNIKNIYYSGTETDFNSIKFFIPYGATVGYNAKPNEKYDINCDDKIDVLDIIGIKKAISAGETKTYQSDINSDGLLNAEDAAALKKRLLNY